MRVPVLIVGAGPTGLLTANLLGTYGIETLVIERNATTSDFPKAILLDDEGLRALQTAGLSEEVLGHVIAGYGAKYFSPDGECFAEVDSPITLHGYARRNAFLQPDLERLMLAGLSRFKNVEVRFETELAGFTQNDNEVTCRIQKSVSEEIEVKADIVLGCDGASSFVRKHLSIALEGETDARDWVVVDTINDPDRDRFSKFFCDPARPMVSIPAPGGGRRYEYMIMPGENANEMVARETIGNILGKFRHIPDEDIIRAVVYTFHARVAAQFVNGRVALLGDAAHLTPPFAGQGMNAGLRDAYNVAWKAARIVRRNSDIDLLSTYHIERKKPVKEMVDYAVALGEIVMPLGGLDNAARERIRGELMGVSSVGGAAQMRAKPQAAYREGVLLPDVGVTGTLTGRPLPQFPLSSGDKGKILLDDELGEDFALFAIGEEAARTLGAINVPANINTTSYGNGCALGAISNDFGLNEQTGRILLVRPDRFVAATWSHEMADRILGDIRRLV